MMQCAYAIFSKDASISAAYKVSVQDFFSHIILRAPGTTKFNLVLGLWGIPKGQTGTMKLDIATPDGQGYSGEWTTRESSEECEVHNVIWDLSSIPLTSEGIYTFVVLDEPTHQIITRRLLKVSISSDGADSYE